MIICIGIQPVKTTIEVEVIAEVRTYSIISGFMSDDCRPHKIGLAVMLWLDQDGFLGEIECIFPRIVEQPLGVYTKDMSVEGGFPLWEVQAYDNISRIEPTGKGFVLWLTEGKVITRHIRYKHLRFFLSENELVAISVLRNVRYL